MEGYVKIYEVNNGVVRNQRKDYLVSVQEFL